MEEVSHRGNYRKIRERYMYVIHAPIEMEERQKEVQVL